MIGDFTGEERGLRAGCSGIVGGEAVQKDAEREGPFPICGTKLRSHTGQDSGQDVSAAALGHAGISRGIDEGASIGRGENGVKSFEDHVGIPGFCGFQGQAKAVGLHFVVRKAAEAGHLAGMRCDGELRRFSFGEFLGAAGEGIQSVGVEEERLLRFLDERSYEALSFFVSSQARPDGEQSFVFGKRAEATGL